jgi:hypothetical protein
MLATRLVGRIASRVPRNVVLAAWHAYWAVAAEYAEEARRRGVSAQRGTTDTISLADAVQVLGLNPDDLKKLDEKDRLEAVQARWTKMYEINAPDPQTGEGGSPYLQAIVTNARNTLVGSVVDSVLDEDEGLEEGVDKKEPGKEKEKEKEPKGSEPR